MKIIIIQRLQGVTEVITSEPADILMCCPYDKKVLKEEPDDDTVKDPRNREKCFAYTMDENHDAKLAAKFFSAFWDNK
jgi:hypothetical protein